MAKKLYVVATLFNPWDYQTIIANFERFAAQMEANPDVVLIKVEVAFADRPFVVTDARDERCLQLRTKSALWHKESALNLGRQHVQRVFPDAEKIAFIDADVEFLRADWAKRVMLSLDHHDVIQPWSEAIYAGPESDLAGIVTSFMFQYCSGVKWSGHPPKYGTMWHPGFAWAWRLDALDRVGGLLDINIVGGGDLEMALALIGLVDEALLHQSINPGDLPVYEAALRAWEKRAESVVRKNVGYVPGMIRHYHHGHQQGRQYESRYAIPLRHTYNPAEDIVRSGHGLYEWAPHVVGLRHDVRGMFARRNDDANTKG